MTESHQSHPITPPTRAALERDLKRTSTAVIVILVIVLTLALVAVFAGFRASGNLSRAEAAEAEVRERLWNSYIAQASALRLTAKSGRREKSLDVISNAAAIRPSLELRTEAVATLALADLKHESASIPLPPGMDSTEMDAQLTRIAYGESDGSVQVSSVTNGMKLFSLEARDAGPGMRMAARSTSFSPDGRFLTARFAGGALVTWDLSTRERILAVGTNSTNVVIAGMSYTADSTQLMFSDPDHGRQITIFNLVKPEKISTGIPVGARAFRFRPGSQQVGVVTDNNVELMEHPNETVLKTFEHLTRVFLLAWSPSGAQLVVACEDGDVYVWDADRGTHRLLRGHSEPCIRLGFSPDGKILFTGSRDGTTRLWDAESGQLIVATEHSVAHTFSPDGKRMGYWQLSKAFGTWKVDLSDCYASLRCPKTDGAFMSLDLSTDGRWCIATQTKGVRVWDLAADNRESFYPVTGLLSARIAPDGKSFYVCLSNKLERWPIAESSNSRGELAFGSAVEVPLPDGAGARNIAVSLDGSAAAVELTDNRLAVIDLKTARSPVIFPERWRGVNQKGAASPTGAGRFAISPDGRWVCTGYWFGANDLPRVWDAQTGKVIANTRMATALATFSADGKWLGLAGVNEFQIYSTTHGETNWSRVAKIKRDESSFTHGAMAFLGDGQIGITRTRQIVQLRDAFSENKFLDLVAPVPQSVASMRLSLDGKVMVTGSARDVIQLWRLDRIREKLSTMHLDWEREAEAVAAAVVPKPTFWRPTNTILILGLAGFLIVAVLSLLTLRRHRAAIERYFTSEEETDARNRELEVAKVELMHSQKMQALGTLATGIAHDFNNLLSVIRMSNKLVGREAKGNADIQENVAEIEQAVLQGKNVVGSMLGYARSDEGEGKPTDISAVVEEAVSLLSKEFLSGIALTLELNRHAPHVGLGRGRIEQVLLNLIVNASEAMQGQGKLKITVQPRASAPNKHYFLWPATAAQYVELSVIDSGPGIAPEVRARLFEPFFTTKRSGSKAGTGLGLSLVYSIAQQESLGLSVESEPGKGATFTLVMPVK